MEDWLPSLPANWTPPRGDRVVLKNVNEVIRDVLELTGFVSYFVFE